MFHPSTRSLAGRPAKPQRGLRDRVALGVRRVAVLVVGHRLLEALDGGAYVVEGVVERGEAESRDVGVAEVADDLARDEGLYDAVRLLVPEGHLAAPARVRPWRHDLDDTRQALLDQRDEQVGELQRSR